jgi:hypothetical protein
MAVSAASAGYDRAAAEVDLANWKANSTAVDEASTWLKETFRSEDEELNALYSYSLNASISSYKQLGEGFTGYFAGIDYQSPPRTYFRDGYWTLTPIYLTIRSA